MTEETRILTTLYPVDADHPAKVAGEAAYIEECDPSDLEAFPVMHFEDRDPDEDIADSLSVFVVAECRYCASVVFVLPDEVGTDGLAECSFHNERPTEDVDDMTLDAWADAQAERWADDV